jgi:uncharacterized protein RhaS with RHS repeats
MYNYGYRDYQPVAARFTTEDPVRDGANWFAYVNNDPVNWVDKFGLNPETVFDEFMRFIQQQGVEREYSTAPYKYERIADSWDALPLEVTNYLNIQNPANPITQRAGNHEGNQLRLPGGYHIAEERDETGESGVYVHYDKIDPLRSPVDAALHGFFEVKFSSDPKPKSTDDRRPDWCSGK